ncbi:MAG: hypothetical protein HC900_02665 [Methylacidiphilales bacterium]|nr:hypothetical protein [Candidatus Methylacidiphilales bacterium]
MLRRVATIACAALFCSPVLYRPAVAQSPISLQHFGMHIHGWAYDWPTIPIGSRRNWDTWTVWATINSVEDQYDWNEFSTFLSTAEQHGLDVLFTLGGSNPLWASSDPYLDCPPPDVTGRCAPPTPAAWEKWVNAVVAKSRENIQPGSPGRIKYWEIWNEPNFSTYWRGDMATMVDLARRAYRIIKAADPTAKVLTPAVATGPWGGPEDGAKWLIDFLAQCSTGDPCADIVGFHAYSSHYFSIGNAGIAPGTIDPLAFPLIAEQAIIDPQKYQNIAATFGLEAVWNTEGALGVWTTEGNSAEALLDPQTVKNWELLGQYAVKTTMLMHAGGVERSYWYAYDNRATGMLWQWADDRFGTTLNPAGVAYNLMATHFIGATPVSAVARQQTAETIRNPTAAGAVVGQPGTLPTHWSVYRTDAGVSTAVVGTGSGYVDIRVWGTPVADGLTWILFEEPGAIASGVGKQWFGSFNQRLVGGSLTNVTVHAGVYEFAAGGGPLSHTGAQTVPPTTLDHTLQRFLFMTLTHKAECASVVPVLAFLHVPGQAFDITLRLSSPHFDDGTKWTGTYSKPDGSSLILAWDSSTAGSSLAVDPAYTQYQDLTGAFHPVSGNSVPLTMSPVFILAGAP